MANAEPHNKMTV